LRYNLVNCFLQLFGNRISEDDQFGVGIPIYLIKILEKFISGTPVPFRLINGIKRTMAYVKLQEVELYSTLLPKARNSGLNDILIRSLIF
jgi:tetrahydromethanopterin S-methyltransferase subunit E